MKRHINLICALVAGAALFLSGQWSFLTSVHPFPAPDSIREVRQSAVEDALALSLGLRRLAADIWYIRLMQYYGSSESDDPEAARSGPDIHYGEGDYPEFLPLARHVLALDPYFTSAGLYAAGSLAFNMARPEEAVGFLKGALLDRPKEWKYLTLIAAIGYSKAKDPAKVSEVIEPLLKEPDCPVMLRQLAAFLNKKAGNYKKAYFIYRTILHSSKDKFYVENARKEMAKLEKFLN